MCVLIQNKVRLNETFRVPRMWPILQVVQVKLCNLMLNVTTKADDQGEPFLCDAAERTRSGTVTYPM
jgi:hypothetical protein